MQDLLGWNPITGPLPDGLPDPFDPAGRPLSRLELLARSLEWVALVELSGLVHGSATADGGVEGEDEDEQGRDGDGGESEGVGSNRVLSAECRLLHVLKWLPAFRESLYLYTSPQSIPPKKDSPTHPSHPFNNRPLPRPRAVPLPR